MQSFDTCYSFAESDMITLQVGEKESLFRVHKDLLTNSGSEFFTAALENFSEAQTNTIRLLEDDAQVVRGFVEWLYSRKVTSLELTNKLPKDVIGVLLFGDKIGAEAFMNDLMDALRAALYETRFFSIPEHIIPLLDAGLPDSKIYQLGIWSFVYQLNNENSRTKKQIKQSVKELNGRQELIDDIFDGILDRKNQPSSDPNTWAACYFHEHKDGSKCPAKRT